MSENNVVPLYNFIPLQVDPELNETLRQIDDSFQYLLEELQGLSNVPFAPAQFYDKFGANEDVDTGSVPEDIWLPGGVLTWPTVAAQASIVSTSAADAAAGTGAQEVEVQGVDGNFDFTSEIVVPNGVTPVNTVNSYLFIHRANNQVCGSGGVNAGDIDISIGGNLVARIGFGRGQTEGTHIVIPNATTAGQSPYLKRVELQVGRNQGVYAVVHLLKQEPGKGIRLQKNFIVNDGGPIDEILTPSALLPGTRLWLQCVTIGANNTQVSGGYDINYFVSEN